MISRTVFETEYVKRRLNERQKEVHLQHAMQDQAILNILSSSSSIQSVRASYDLARNNYEATLHQTAEWIADAILQGITP